MARKIIFTMLAAFAFSALVASSAFAEETLKAAWLIGTGTELTTSLTTEVTGALLLKDKETIAGSAAVLCKATADGSVEANGEGETKEILNANKEAVAELGGLALLGTGAATGEGSECVSVETCAAGTAASPIEVWPVGLPWLILVFLDAILNKFLVLIFSMNTTVKNIGYELLCLVLGINTEDTCVSPANDFEFEVANDPENVAILAGVGTTPNAMCSQSGNKQTGENIADELTEIKLTSGELLSVSSTT
jgi:hypothetical protein